MQTTEYKDYLYAPVRINFAKTGEVFNIGVIVMDENKENRVFRSINSFVDIENCLRIEEPSSHDFMLNMLNTKLTANDLKFGDNYSNSMYIEIPEWISSDKSISDTANELFDELVTVKRAIENSRKPISEHTPMKIITSMEAYAHEKKYKRIDFRNKKVTSMGKMIDAVVYKDLDYTNPLIGIDVATPAIKDFSQRAVYSAVSLSKAIEFGFIKNAILRLPDRGDKTSKLEYKNTYRDIYNGFKDITVIDTSENDAFFEVLDKQTRQLGSSLF